MAAESGLMKKFPKKLANQYADRTHFIGAYEGSPFVSLLASNGSGVWVTEGCAFGSLDASNSLHAQVTSDQVTALASVFSHQTKDKFDKLDRLKFRDFLYNQFKMTDEFIMDRIFKAFDRDNDSLVTLDDWIIGLSVFLLGTDEERTIYCFSVYNVSSDVSIGRDEMFQLLKSCISRQHTDEDPDEGVRDLIELILKKMDLDHDGRVGFDDFQQSVKSDSLFLEIFGNCLPSPKATESFLQHLTNIML